MIIGLTGKAGAGKDTAADYLVAHHGFTKLSWAGPLKAMLAAGGFPEPADRAEKELQVPGFDFSWRQAAQALGTEWGRALDPNIWIRAVGRQIAAAAPGTRFVLSDTRFDNEADALRSLGGHVCHIKGRAVDLGALAGHASEAGVTYEPQDWVLVNDGTLASVYSALDALIALETKQRRRMPR